MIDNIHEKIADVDWQTVTGEMNKKGYALVSRFLLGQACDELAHIIAPIYIARPSQWKDIVLD